MKIDFDTLDMDVLRKNIDAVYEELTEENVDMILAKITGKKQS